MRQSRFANGFEFAGKFKILFEMLGFRSFNEAVEATEAYSTVSMRPRKPNQIFNIFFPSRRV
jgi:hypothetical protein